MLRGVVTAALVASALALAAAPAQATILIATLHAVGHDGGPDEIDSRDPTGLFGSADENAFQGKAIDLSLTYDTNGSGWYDGGPSVKAVQGGPDINIADTILDSTTTINGVTRHNALNHYADIFIGLFGGVGNLDVESSGSSGQYFEGWQVFGFLQIPGFMTDLRTPVDISFFKPNFGLMQIENGASQATSSSLDFTGFTIREAAAAAPEPAAWSLLITGFGLAGAALRRRQVAPA